MRRCVLWLLTAAVVARAGSGERDTGPGHDRVVVCYVASWAVYRPERGAFPLERLDPALCTHLVYSFSGLDSTTDLIKSLDPWQDLTDNYGKGGYTRLVALKGRYPHLKVTLAIGGWNEGSLKYSKMAADPEARKKFVTSAVNFLQRFGFDGLDLDWEYPARRDGRPEDKANFVTLVKELKEALEPHAMILTAALGAGKDTMDAAYDLPRLSKYLDFLHLMCYDYHGSWDGVLGPNAPLYGSHDRDVLSVEYTIKYMISHGVSPYKMVLGLPLYGRTFLLTNPAEESVRFGVSPVQSRGFAGPFTKEEGFMGYNEICALLPNSTWQRLWDERSATPYLRSGDRVVSYDNSRSLAMKIKMATDYDLGGVMVWSIDTDDFMGDCALEDDSFVDFRSRLEDMRREPAMRRALDNLDLPDSSLHASTHSLLKTNRSLYVLDNGVLNLRLPLRETNYPLMHDVNNAVALALQEKSIVAEVERARQELDRENEIPDEGRVKGTAGVLTASAFTMCILFAFCRVVDL